jgi:DNA repair protein SbcC/Rad50
MPAPTDPDALQQQLAAVEQRLQGIELAQRNAAVTITRQLEAFIQLHSLIGQVPGLLHGWPVSADFGLHMLQLLLCQPPELVIEFGSGTSSYLLLQGLAQAFPHCTGSSQGARSAPQLLTFEHLAPYHQLTAELIAPCRLRRHAQLLLAPLQPWNDPCSDSSDDQPYYSQLERITAAAAALRRKRQRPLRRLLVIVDGPPGATGPQARYPALPALLDATPADPAHPLQVCLLLDDMIRADEQATATAWQALLAERGIAATRRDHGFEKGALELRFAL